MQFKVRKRDYALYGEVNGVLETLSTDLFIKVGSIDREWCDWIPALAYIPMQPTWVWIMDPKWGYIVKNCFLNVAIINGNHCSLPPVDIILLSRITPLYCCIFLSSCPLALVLSISRLRHLHGWTLRFWKVKYYTVGGCTDGSWNIYSLHRVGFLLHPTLLSLVLVPMGNIQRVLNPCAGKGTPVGSSTVSRMLRTTNTFLVSETFSVANSECKVVVTSVYSSSSLCARCLSFEEMLLVYDHSPLVTNLLSSHHRKLLLNFKQVPSRILGFLFRHLLADNKGGDGSVGEELSGRGKLSQLSTLKREIVDDVELQHLKRCKGKEEKVKEEQAKIGKRKYEGDNSSCSLPNCFF